MAHANFSEPHTKKFNRKRKNLGQAKQRHPNGANGTDRSNTNSKHSLTPISLYLYLLLLVLLLLHRDNVLVVVCMVPVQGHVNAIKSEMLICANKINISPLYSLFVYVSGGGRWKNRVPQITRQIGVVAMNFQGEEMDDGEQSGFGLLICVL